MNRFIPCSLATCITERVFACLSFRFLQLSKSCKVCVRACLYIVWTRYSRRKSQRVPANPKSRSKTDAHCLPGLESIYSCIPPYHSISLTRITRKCALGFGPEAAASGTTWSESLDANAAPRDEGRLGSDMFCLRAREPLQCLRHPLASEVKGSQSACKEDIATTGN